jgi:hypothetical protein
VLAPDGAGGTEILLTQTGGGGGGGGGQGNTDLMAWAQPGSGPWSRASSWYDVTTGAAATAPPGSMNDVQIAGPSSGALQTVTGPAACASLAFFGNTLLNGAFSIGSLAVGGTLAGNFATALVDLGPSTGLTVSAAAAIQGGTLVLDNAASLFSAAGTLTLGSADMTLPASVLAASNGGIVQLGGLLLAGGGTLTTDITASVEVGTLGGAAAGAVTIDPGIVVAGSGSLNALGSVIDNGTLTAQGGTLLVGAVSGTGVLTIGTEAVLWLGAGDTVPIQFIGGGGTLLLPGSSETPAGVIAGFAQGDLIVTGSSQVGSVSCAPCAGGVGTLTLYNGSQVAGTLLLAGDFSGDVFTVQPDGAGSAIGVQAAGGGPPAGTSTPDLYVWTGNTGTLWNSTGNWTDLTTGQTPAAVAPGLQNLVTVQGGTGAFTSILGPADAAALTLLGRVALSGQYSIGALKVGNTAQTGLLALGQGAALQAASVAVSGGIALAGSGLVASGTVTLAQGVLAASAQAAVDVAALVLAGSGDAVTTDATARVEVGNQGGAQAGAVTVDPGCVLSGAGAVNPAGTVVDFGTITASGGTVVLGNVSGGGILEVGVGASLALEGTADASLTVDFAGPGTLAVLGALPAAFIAGFGLGDTILLPMSGITEADYAPTAPNTGVLTLLSNGQAVGQLTLLGVSQGQSFSVAGAAGGTVLTTIPTDWGGGGSKMRNPPTGNGSGQSGYISDLPFWQSLSNEIQGVLAGFEAANNNNSYVWTSDGSYFGPWQPGYSNVAVAMDPTALIQISLPPAYNALLAQGYNPVTLVDFGAGHALLVGDSANDTIVGDGAYDTLAGGSGGNNLFFATAPFGDVVYGSGNDTIITGQGNCSITTAVNSRSLAYLGSAANVITLNGRDTVVASGGAGTSDTINAVGADTVFAPGQGELVHNGGNAPDTVVGNQGGSIDMNGGTGNGSILWCGGAAFAVYHGGGGWAEIAGGSGDLQVTGGAGAMTIFGGTGNTQITGAPGPSEFVVGAGAATVTAASGNLVWLAGAGNESLVAAGGNVIIWGANSTGNNVLQAGSGPCTLHGGIGNDIFLGGSGNATMSGGGGGDLFSFTNGLGGGNDIITDFSAASDRIELHGFSSYGSALVNGSEVLSLADGTHIQLNGITSLAGVTITLG